MNLSLRSITNDEDISPFLDAVLVKMGKDELSSLLDVAVDCLEEGKEITVSYSKLRELSNEDILQCCDRSSQNNKKKTNNLKIVSDNITSTVYSNESNSNVDNQVISDSQLYNKQKIQDSQVSDLNSEINGRTDHSWMNARKFSRKKRTASDISSSSNCESEGQATIKSQNAEQELQSDHSWMNARKFTRKMRTASNISSSSNCESESQATIKSQNAEQELQSDHSWMNARKFTRKGRIASNISSSSNCESEGQATIKSQNAEQELQSAHNELKRIKKKGRVVDERESPPESMEKSQISAAVISKLRSKKIYNEIKPGNTASNNSYSKGSLTANQSKRKVNTEGASKKLQRGKESGILSDENKKEINSELSENQPLLKNAECEKMTVHSNNDKGLEDFHSLNTTEHLNCDTGFKKKSDTACKVSQPIVLLPKVDCRDISEQCNSVSKGRKSLQRTSKLLKQEKGKKLFMCETAPSVSSGRSVFASAAEQGAFVTDGSDVPADVEPNCSVQAQAKDIACDKTSVGSYKSDNISAKSMSSDDDNMGKQSITGDEKKAESDLSDSNCLLISSLPESELNYKLQKQSCSLDIVNLSCDENSENENFMDQLDLENDAFSSSKYEKLKEQFERAGLDLEEVAQSIDEKKLRKLARKAGKDGGMLLRFPHFCPYSKQQVGPGLIILDSLMEYIKAKERISSTEMP